MAFAAAKLQDDPDYLIKNTIVADGTASTGPNCGGIQPVSQGNNLVNLSGECGTSAGMNDVNAAPGVSALQANGGPTLTRKLLPGSQAIDKGNQPVAWTTTATRSRRTSAASRGRSARPATSARSSSRRRSRSRTSRTA